MNLIPEKRMDVNGRLVTRHVKPQGVNPPRSVPLPPLPPLDLYSADFGSSLKSATAISESIYLLNDSDELFNIHGEEIHEYVYEEARDALTDILPTDLLVAMDEKITKAKGRHKALLAELLYENIEDYCFAQQNTHDGSGDSSGKLGKITLQYIRDSIELAGLADDFVHPDRDREEILVSMHNASRSIRRAFDTKAWKDYRTDDDARANMIDSEFIINFVTAKTINHEAEKSPAEIYEGRLVIMDNYSRIKENQDFLFKRGEVSVALLDDMEQTTMPLREGNL